jgi:hypothetical protein
MSASQDQRKYPRADVIWPVKAQLADKFMEMETRNISAGGAWLYPEFPAEPGELFHLTLEPPQHTPISTTAKVVWKSLVFQDGLGICFVEISDEDRQFIFDVVSDHLHSEQG